MVRYGVAADAKIRDPTGVGELACGGTIKFAARCECGLGCGGRENSLTFTHKSNTHIFYR